MKSRCFFGRKAGRAQEKRRGLCWDRTGASQLNRAMRLAATAGAHARWAAADGLDHYARPGRRDHPADAPARARHGPGRASADPCVASSSEVSMPKNRVKPSDRKLAAWEWAQLPAPIERYRGDVSLQGCASHRTGREWEQAMRLA